MEAEPDEKVNSAPVSVFPVKFHTPGVSSKTAPWIVPVPERHSIVSVIGLRFTVKKTEDRGELLYCFLLLKANATVEALPLYQETCQPCASWLQSVWSVRANFSQ